jgi:hypothetical protein
MGRPERERKSAVFFSAGNREHEECPADKPGALTGLSLPRGLFFGLKGSEGFF